MKTDEGLITGKEDVRAWKGAERVERKDMDQGDPRRRQELVGTYVEGHGLGTAH